MLPAALVDKLTPAAFEHLMAHELGHIALRRSRWGLAWTAAVALFLISFACMIGLVALVASRGGGNGLILAAVGVFFVCMDLLPLAAYINRHQEFKADLYATRIQGSIQGAREHMDHNERLRATYATKQGRGPQIMSTHPRPQDRLAYLQRAFKDD